MNFGISRHAVVGGLGTFDPPDDVPPDSLDLFTRVGVDGAESIARGANRQLYDRHSDTTGVPKRSQHRMSTVKEC